MASLRWWCGFIPAFLLGILFAVSGSARHAKLNIKVQRNSRRRCSHQFMSASARSISFDLGSMGYSGAMLETILVSPTGAVGAEPSEPLQLAPYGIFIGEIRSRKGP